MRKLLCFALILTCAQVFAHKYHKSAVYLKLDKQESKLQVVVELNTADLEGSLRRRFNLDQDFTLEDLKNGDFTDEAVTFFNEHLGFKKDHSVVDLEWFGIQIKSRITSVFLTGQLEAKDLNGLVVFNNLLFRYNHHQVNYIYVEESKKTFQTSLDKNVNEVLVRL